MPEKSNLYTLLGVSPKADTGEIRRAYHDAARRLHPDVNVEPGATELFLRVQDAYEVLSDPNRRMAYDLSQVAAPPKPAPVAVQCTYSRSAVLQISEPQLIYALLELEPRRETAAAQAPVSPLNVCLILDRSTSMQGERMDTLKAAAVEVIRQLRPEDTLAVIAFGDRAEVMLPAGRRYNRDEVATRIRMIRTGGGTEILRGLEAGFFEVRRNLNKSSINHLILITDGRTYGDEEDCMKIANQAASLGLRISCFGIGHEWNDDFLDKIAERTGGSCFYVSETADIRHFLQEKFMGLNQVYAEKVMLHLESRPGVTLKYAYRANPEAAPLETDSPLYLGSIQKNSPLSVLMEFVISAVPPGLQEITLFSGEVSFEIPSLPNPAFQFPVTLSRPVSNSFSRELPPRRIFQALSRITLYRLQDQARQDVMAGNIERASLRLQNLATHLISQGHRELAQTVLVEAEHIHNTKAFSDEGEKRIKYGTRALLLPAPTMDKRP